MARVVPLPVTIQLVCSKCGASGEGSCRCAAPYVPPGRRAAEAVKASPDKSNRAMAAEVGVDEVTIRRARNKSGAAFAAPRKHRGKDGKSYPAKRKGKSLDISKLPLNQQVNKLLDRLSHDVDFNCHSIVTFLEAHPELEQEGRDAIIHFLQISANKLLDKAQMIDGRSAWQSALT